MGEKPDGHHTGEFMGVQIDPGRDLPKKKPAPLKPRRRPSPADLAVGLTEGDRSCLARSITLAESNRPDHRAESREIIQAVLPHTGNAHRIGITGVPGVGKSSAIETFGKFLTGRGHKVAVLAVDPSSRRTGGSILGDKTRMESLSADPNAFIRPSPSAGTLGGVARATRETMMLCEAGGYDVILVETVGVGQSETVVSEMVDVFLVLMLPGAGDELQGIKKGILELADIIAVNKADGENVLRAEMAAREYRNALHIVTPASVAWTPQVLTMSALNGTGLDELWDTLKDHHKALDEVGELAEKRRGQRLRWMWAMVEESLQEALRANPNVKAMIDEVEQGVHEGTLDPTAAGERIIAEFLGNSL